MSLKRKQLTLFVDQRQAGIIDKIRLAFNPLQYEIIGSHVTLCREDEIENIENVIDNLENLNHEAIELDFGKPIRFAEGKEVLMPAKDDDSFFQNLRSIFLKGIVGSPRKHEPHLTLMHPRNSTCTEEIFQRIEEIELPTKIRFSTISLIEQELGKAWNVLRKFDLKKKMEH